MTPLRLKTLAPDGPDGTSAALVERRKIDAIREEAYQKGYLEGQAAATDAFLAEQNHLSAELIETLADARLTNEAARRHVTATIGPLIAGIVKAVAPTLADAGIASEIVSLVERALSRAGGPRPRVRCAPELVERIALVLRERGLDADVEPASDLLPREAQVFWDQGYDHLDLDACVAQIRSCIASHIGPNPTGGDHDTRQLL